MTPQTSAQARSPWMVYDDAGNIWPPGFRAVTTDLSSPHCIVKPRQNVGISLRMSAARNAALARGEEWAGGIKVLYENPENAERKRQFVFKLRKGQIGAPQIVHEALLAMRAKKKRAVIAHNAALDLTGLNSSRLTFSLQRAIDAGVLGVEIGKGGATSYTLGSNKDTGNVY